MARLLLRFSASSLTFVPAQKTILLNANHLFFSNTKCLWLPQYVNKFLFWHKKFGPVLNILGPVRGQGINLFYSLSNRLRFWPHLTPQPRPTPRYYQGLTCPGLLQQQLWGLQPLTLWQSKVQALEIQSLGLECLEIQPLLDWPRPHKGLLLFSWSLWAFHQAYGLRYRKIIF